MVIHPSIQPILCVIGHSVAGNPMQFAIERAIADANLDWKFVSLNVQPAQLAEAVAGVKAMGFAGAAIANPFETSMIGLLDDAFHSSRRSGWVDCVLRTENEMVGKNQLGAAVFDLLIDHDWQQPKHATIIGIGPKAQAIGVELETQGLNVSFLLTDEDAPSGKRFEDPEDRGGICREVPNVEDAAIVVADNLNGNSPTCDEIELHFAGAACLVDISLDPKTTHGNWTLPTTVFTGLDLLVRSLVNYFRDWTGEEPNESLIREACEEYLEL